MDAAERGTNSQDRQLSADELARRLRIPKLSSDEPDWLWYADPTNYEPLLADFGLSADEYEAALRELLLVYPSDWPEEQYQAHLKRSPGSGFAEFTLHPEWGKWQIYHPVPMLLTGRIRDWLLVGRLIKHGLDLARTAELPKISQLRKDLRDEEQFNGRLFELELLSHAQAAGLGPVIMDTPDAKLTSSGREIYLEMRHRGAPLAMAIAMRVNLPWRDDWGSLEVQIKVSEARGLKREHAAIAETINQAIKELVDARQPNVHESPDFRITYDPSTKARTLTVSFGTESTTAGELERITHLALGEKSRQLQEVGEAGNPCLVALDCQSLVRPVEEREALGEDRYRQQLEWREAILRAGRRFLNETPWLSGMLVCWPRSRWYMTYRDVIYRPFKLVLLTRSGETDVTSPQALVQALAIL